MNRASGCRPRSASRARATTSPPGREVDGLQTATASAGSVTLLSVQWDQPSLSANGRRGAQSDVDVWFYDANGEPIEICTDDPAQVVCQIPGFDANIGGDAVETPIMVNFSDEDIEVQIGIELFEGPAPNYVKYVWFDLDAGRVHGRRIRHRQRHGLRPCQRRRAPRPSARPPGTRPRSGAARCARSACRPVLIRSRRQAAHRCFSARTGAG